MTTPFWPAGQTPYVTPDQIYNTSGTSQWPIGAQFGTLPDVSTGAPTSAQTQAVLSMICASATAEAESILGQPVRSTISTEYLEGPHFRVTVQWHSKNVRIITSRWPVIAVAGVSVSPNSVWPRSWTALPAQYFEPEFPPQGLYGTNTAIPGEGAQSIIGAPGYVTWALGRQGFRVMVSYWAGWPHTSLTADVSAGASSIDVDDVTGWAVTALSGSTTAGIVYDAIGGGQESVTVTAATAANPLTLPDGTVVQSGPGTLTLASALAYPHAAGIMVSSLPADAIWATALLCGAHALKRGATATTIQTIAGRQVSGERGLRETAKTLLSALRRTQ